MSLAVVRSRAAAPGRAPEVTVEVHLANGLPSFAIVGLPDLEVRESRERVRAALQNCGFDFPVRRITVNLAPADLPKESGRFDLPIALGILAASGQIPAAALAHREFAGELSLTGAVRAMRGAFAMACGTARGHAEDWLTGNETDSAAHQAGDANRAVRAVHADRENGAGQVVRAVHANDLADGLTRTNRADRANRASLANGAHRQERPLTATHPARHPAEENASPYRLPQLYLPAANAAEAALVPDVDVFGVTDLPSLCAHLSGALDARLSPVAPPAAALSPRARVPDMADVIGQRSARRALEVAAAGGHHMLMVGPPGAGKSMLAARLPGLLPPMTDAEALGSAALLSASTAGFSAPQWRQRPFRAPHHTASAAALIGGHNPPQPGEITLAHLGVLFLDELPEFDRHALEALREPLEAGAITISRAAWQTDFPAACQLIAAMNPCPCGWRGDPGGRCRCTPDTVARYLRKLSGPLLDRIDIQIEVPALPPAELAARAFHSGHAARFAQSAHIDRASRAPRPPGPSASPHSSDSSGNAPDLLAADPSDPFNPPDASAAAESSAVIARRVRAARERQLARQGKINRELSARETDALCRPDAAGQALLRAAGERFGWSARAYYRVLKVARSIADLAGDDMPSSRQVAEAIQYRRVFADR